ncbi:MAG: cyclic nucleotide-binding domain-containing protein [Gammaproteobacteria bacterium]|nr:cyclic nucleotide-binding domain-containing protein [Gammaproteobacteria bacterium]
MVDEKETVDRRVLASLVPIDGLSSENFEEVYKKTALESAASGSVLFKKGGQDNQAVYLIKGTLDLHGEHGDNTVIRADTPEARHPVAHHQPRNMTATARSDIQFIRIDNDLLDILLTWDQSAGYVVSELDEDDDANTDWMTRMLQSNIFYQIPPANIQEVFKRMEEMPMKAGEAVICQGDVGDYYYIISQGRAEVTRKSPTGTDVRLAELQQGDGFGEEALITECERNATITMLTNGTLMRMSKADFDNLLKAPVMHEVDLEDGQELVRDDGAVWLDVRLESEFNNSTIEGSINIPLYLLRLRLHELDEEKPYIVFCDTGRRSSAAAYLLSEAGYDIYVLGGGYR